ncbi:MAG TPA: hypothetical protein VGV18_12740, partial [Verrucomicrobiae bacterium]|nr:hypothetical protein [Verrucomicrobiae bacterium]
MSATKPPPTHIRNEARNHWHGDANMLAAKLKKAVSGEVRFDAGTRSLYSTDSSNYRQIPIGAVVPKTVEDVVHTV